MWALNSEPLDLNVPHEFLVMSPTQQENRVARKALDQSSRYADLSLDEATLIKRPSCVFQSF